MSSENNKKQKFVLKEIKGVLRTLKKPIEENVEKVEMEEDEN